ncbi:MAG: hypothetical protein AW06_004109 [Candidatus Accumulibacter cognatus]|uniref:Uncharacterized protein n=1 Tax=Candidatus Accumulibacter cognatus TaxID=2954383 RepID=A0A080M0W1_9PROT|nr:MAG: hypothetical protein AW06_004109 [Candidatus Accumulibacter cognatus]
MEYAGCEAGVILHKVAPDKLLLLPQSLPALVQRHIGAELYFSVSLDGLTVSTGKPGNGRLVNRVRVWDFN